MVDQSTQSIVIQAAAAEIMAVISDFASYPEWVEAVKETEVLSTTGSGQAEKVRFVLDAGVVKDTYVNVYEWAEDGLSVSWTLSEGQVQKAQQGSYRLAPKDGGTEVTYSLAVDLAIPMIGMFKRKAEKMIMNTALKELKRRVEARS
ncbi:MULTISPECIES: SRPBCC family protein [Saccharopolyspora]|uniref:SRPBCC family protein n=1 Tax=Saccharopolyspora gregorii TaxID=33914 RepID=A0ABP6RVK0_9PSEU|nr:MULTISPECIES: SRPBCC family protein [Saccharopolyspora]MCA1187411.1 SRPBCC family protein [Saccharopolyspora sp. 6T]MCA1192484.1 SRPBCC family protein [Saccharopolyspora sp. 6V]MCA1224476.1 SRPBCC family protein [Saccharopolyspora sp. 6M]MCA1281354.1 SRPBCC family protein [Saccharopolyspora sp. 7B]